LAAVNQLRPLEPSQEEARKEENKRRLASELTAIYPLASFEGDTPWNVAKPSSYTSAQLHVCDQRKGCRKCDPDARLDAARDATIAKDGTLMSQARGNIQPLPPSILDGVSSWGEEITRHGQKSRWMCGYDEARTMLGNDTFSFVLYALQVSKKEGKYHKELLLTRSRCALPFHIFAPLPNSD